MRSVRMIALAGALAVAACTVPPARDDTSRTSKLPPVVSPADNPTTPDKVALGAKLWIDPRLSGSGKTACTSCHVREKGWTDGLVLSRRDNGDLNTRHTPTMYNVGYSSSFYWDGRAPTLEAQVLAAWRVQISADPAKSTARIAAVPQYVAEFQKIFGAPPTEDAVVKSLAAYLRAKVSGLSPWDRYEMGQADAVSTDAGAGFDLFMGKARCAICHTPPSYSDFKFHNVGLEAGKPKPDVGRAAVTKRPEDTSAFKTPTLRSVAISGPYFHDGSRATLEQAVRYMASGGSPDPNKSPLLADVKLTDLEIRQIVAFLSALTSDEPYTPPRIP